jgi:hypothetical protein
MTPELGRQRLMMRGVLPEFVGVDVEVGLDPLHAIHRLERRAGHAHGARGGIVGAPA